MNSIPNPQTMIMDSRKGSRKKIKRKYKSEKIEEIKVYCKQKKLNLVDAKSEPPSLINFPLIKQADMMQLLPRYSLVLSRNHEDSVGVVMDDLDEIQQNFEKLLTTCIIRQKLLKSEVVLINNVEEIKAKKGSRPLLKQKRIGEKNKFKDAKNLAKVIKTKHTSTNNFLADIPKYEVPKVIKTKHDISDRFWISVDPYCQEISKDNILFLEELFNECSQEIDVKIPDIGDHYAIEWTENDILIEQNNGSIKPIKKTLEEKVVEQILAVHEKIKNGHCLDKQNLLDLEQADDEILLEIKRFQCELGAVNKLNLIELSKLHTIVTRDLRKQEIKAALDQVDNQVMNLYNKILLVKQKFKADMKTESIYEKCNVPKHVLVDYDQEVSNVVNQQKLLHQELIELTDFSLLE